MRHRFFLLNADEIKDGRKIGYAYAKAHPERFIDVNGSTGVGEFFSVGTAKGMDHVIHDGKAYMVMKIYYDIDNNEKIIICTECITGCETKDFS